MNYLVIGEPCVDVIHKINGEKIHSYGGILYSVISMAVLSGSSDTVIPIMNLGEDEFENIVNIFKKYPKIKTHGINKVKHPTRKVNLYYNLYNTDKSARIEKSTEPTYTLDYKQCESFFNFSDVILINMISGVDITLDTLKKIRKNYKGYIHMDLHNVVMTTKDDGSRVHMPVENWYEWCTNTDTIQMNEFEIASLTKDKLSEYKIAEEILYNRNYEVKGLIVTRGKIGVTGFTKKEKTYGNETFNDIDHLQIASIENPHFVDSTGCGDVFASSFAIDYSKNNDFVKSIHYANRMASYNSSLKGIDELDKLK
ncbi:MAG TPA: carbohydrate kinase family protein [Ignavibacteria bacterium]|nr:carbohydrate kinase family protein [Ignavibacteria bacterium]